MADKMSRYCSPGSAAFRYTTAGGTDSASGGSGGSGMECMQLRSPPGPFHYLISEQAKSFVALQELQNEVGALLEFRDLVIETFPNLRSKMSPPAGGGGGEACGGGARAGARDWEPGVRVRRKLAAVAADASARAKPQPSVQDSGFSTETSCKDAHSSSASGGSAAAAGPPPPPPHAAAPLEDELWALLDVIQRKGVRLRDDAELLRGELEPERDPSEREHEREPGAPEERFARALAAGCPECGDTRRLRRERDALLAHTAELAAQAAAAAATATTSGTPEPAPAAAPAPPATPLGRLDRVLATPTRPLRVQTPDSNKFAAILRESNPVELQRHLLTSTVHTQVLLERLQRVSNHRAVLLDRLERTREENDDLKFQLEEKSIELEGTKAKMRLLDGKQRGAGVGESGAGGGGGGGGGGRGGRESREHSSMRDMQPLHMPDEPAPPQSPPPPAAQHAERVTGITETPRRGRRSRIPLPGHKNLAPKPPTGRPSIGRESVSSYRSRSGDSHSWRASLASGRSPAASRPRAAAAAPPSTAPAAGARASAVPVRRAASAAAPDGKEDATDATEAADCWYRDSLEHAAAAEELIGEYVERSSRLLRRETLLYRRLCVAAPPPPPPPASPPPQPPTLALELSRSLLYAAPAGGDVLWCGRPQQYFESINAADTDADYDDDSLAR